MSNSQLSTTAEKPAAPRQIAIFFLLAYFIGWGVFGLVTLIARQSGIANGQILFAMAESYEFDGSNLIVPGWSVYLLTRVADFSFSIAGVIMIFMTAGRMGLAKLWRRLTHWRMSWRWYLLGLLPVGLYGLAAAVAGAVSSPNLTAGTVTTALFSLQAGLFVSLFLRGAFGEELGLRGFALPQLQSLTTPARASLLIGVLWAGWHLPVLFGRDLLSVVVFLLLAIGLSFLFTLIFNGSGGSLIPVLLFHATQNWEEGFETLFPALVGTDWELISTLGLLLIGGLSVLLIQRGARQSSENGLNNQDAA